MEQTENMTPIQRATLKQKELRDAGMLVSRSPVEKFIDSPRIGRAVKMFCYECNGYSRSLANTCENLDCPLWLFRRGKQTPDPAEVPLWQKKYTAHMKSAGEYGNTSADPDDTDPDDDDNEAGA